MNESNGSTEDLTRTKYNAVEELAFKALKRYDKNISDVAFYDEISNYGSGTLVLAEVYWPPEKPGGKPLGPYEYQVLIRNGRGAVFSDFSLTFREGSRQAEMISRLASPDVVTAALTLLLVVAYIYFAGVQPSQSEGTKALGAALTTVLGFWFGRQSKA